MRVRTRGAAWMLSRPSRPVERERERERETERERERDRESERARESKYGKVHGHPVTSPLHLVSGFSKKGGGSFLVEGLFRFVLSEQAC